MKILNEIASEDFLKKEGFPIVERKVISTEKELIVTAKDLKLPLVLKVTGRAHKTDIGGVKFIDQESELLPTFKKLQKIGNKEILVQKFIPGYSIIIGLKKDPSFGHVIACGLGGIYTEILKDISFKICPITNKDAKDMLEKLKTYPLLKGARGEKPANIKKIISLLLKVSELSQKHPEILELDINPLIINERSAFIVDALITLQ